MTQADQQTVGRERLATDVATAAQRLGVHVATAESLTGGLLAADLARAPEAASWFRGGVVSYASAVKREVLGIRPGPVVSERAVTDMADGVALLLGASAAVAVSGVAGPSPLEDNPPGTVWFAVRHGAATVAERHQLDGDPDDVRSQTCSIALALLLGGLTAPGDRALVTPDVWR